MGLSNNKKINMLVKYKKKNEENINNKRYFMRKKKVPSNKPRSEIITDNVFLYLKEKGKKQKDLAEACFTQESEISKWKSYKNKISLDDLDKIVDFLGVGMEDLYYSQEEKDRCIPELRKKLNDNLPLTQRLAEIHIGAPTYKIHYRVILSTFILLPLLYLFMRVFDTDKGYNLLISCLLPLIFLIALKLNEQKETFVVNYLSDVFYKIENPKNQYYIYDLISRIVSLIISLVNGSMIVLLYMKNEPGPKIMILFIFILFYLIVSIYRLICLKKKYKNEVFYWEMTSYWDKLKSYLYIAVIFNICIFIDINIFIIILTVIELVSKGIEYILGSIKNNEYKVILMDENKQIIELTK